MAAAVLANDKHFTTWPTAGGTKRKVAEGRKGSRRNDFALDDPNPWR